MAEYKGKLLSGLLRAKRVICSDGVDANTKLMATTASTKQSLGNISTYTPTKNGVIKVATNNSTAGSFVYIADHASGMVLAVCNGYNANTGCFCSCPVYANKQYDFFTNPNSSVIGVEFLALE